MKLYKYLKYMINPPIVPSIKYTYKSKHTYEDRKYDANYIINELQKIPIILEKDDQSKLPDLELNKLIIPQNIKMFELIVYIRKRYLKINHDVDLYVYVGNDNYVPNNNENVIDIYNKYKDHDNFLYCKYI